MSDIYKINYIIAKEEPVKKCFVAGAGSPCSEKKRLTLEQISKYPFFWLSTE